MKQSRVKLLLFLAWVAYSIHSDARTNDLEYGTVIIIGVSKTKVILAADSRGTTSQGPKDNQCKIVALGNEVLFASAGLAEDKSNTLPVELQIEVNEAARDAYGIVKRARLSQKGWDPKTGISVLDGSFAEQVSLEWVSQLAPRFQGAARTRMVEWLKLSPSGGTVSGVFAAPDPRGELNVIIQMLACTPETLARNCEAIYETLEGSNAIAYRPMGIRDIADEYLFGLTDRAKLEREQWAVWRTENAVEGDRRVAIRLVDLTIAFSSKKRFVGGDIDIAELQPGKDIQWIQRKPSCPAN